MEEDSRTSKFFLCVLLSLDSLVVKFLQIPVISQNLKVNAIALHVRYVEIPSSSTFLIPCSRSRNFCILPLAVRGKASTKKMNLGIL